MLPKKMSKGFKCGDFGGQSVSSLTTVGPEDNNEAE